MPTATSKRLYLRGLPPDATKEQLEKLLSSYGSITEVKILPYYAFVQFESAEDATHALETYNKIDLLGKRVLIEYAHPLRRDLPSMSSNNTSPRNAARPGRITRHPIVVLDLPKDIGWKELKDFGRSSGALVSFCDLDKVQRDRGFIEFFSREDAIRAVEVLNGQRLGGQRVRVVDHQDWRSAYSHYGADKHRTVRGRSRSPGRPHHNRYRTVCAVGTMNASSENRSFVGYSERYPGTHAYDASLRGQTWHPRRRRSQEGEYDEHYTRAVTSTGDYDYEYDQVGRRSQEKFDLQVEQEASYLCHRRWFTAAEAEDTTQKFQQHHFDYHHHQGIQDAAHSDGHGLGEQHQRQRSANNLDYHWPGYGPEAGYDSIISDAEYPLRLDEAHLIQQRLTLHSYQ